MICLGCKLLVASTSFSRLFQVSKAMDLCDSSTIEGIPSFCLVFDIDTGFDLFWFHLRVAIARIALLHALCNLVVWVFDKNGRMEE